MTFAEKLQTLRRTKGMSQEQLAEQLNVSRQAISKWELGESMPDTENVIRLSKLFNVSIDYLLNDEFQSDDDIPAVKENRQLLKSEYHKKLLLITGAILSGIGAVGTITLWVLSTMIKVHVTRVTVTPNGTKMYHVGGDILGYDFWTFISEYRLMAILAIMLVLLISGIALILIRNKKFGKKAEK